MDHGSIRRGFPTVNNALARQTALNGVSVGHLATLLGDSLHVEAMQLIHNGTRSAGSEQARLAIDVILEGSRRAGAAQFLDVLGWRFMEPRMSDPEILLREVKAALLDKTGYYGFVAPLTAGLRLGGGACEEIEQAASEWGEHVGIAFQAIDDLKDIVGDPLITGKDVLQDIREGAPSLPLFMLRQRCSQDEWAEALPVLSTGGLLSYSERVMLGTLIDEHRIVKACKDFVASELEAATAVVGKVPHGNDFLCSGMHSLINDLYEHLDAQRDEQRLFQVNEDSLSAP